MKKSNSNGFIKMQLRKAGIIPTRVTSAGVRVWKVADKEFPTLRAIAAEYLKEVQK